MRKKSFARHREFALGVCFFISGMARLVYQVAWAKALGLIFGHTSWWEERVDAVTRAVDAVSAAAQDAEKEAKQDQPESLSSRMGAPARSQDCKLLKELVGERGFEPPTPWSRTTKSKHSKCFIWCRLGTRKTTLSLPQLSRTCTER